ncbi:MAG: hypothetical protein GAK45_01537 [Pseudomonas citronellolis]|nr:MAG: hypothetical protein GAK45_01537 [Pseudomonas citronellolis]
MFIGVYSFYNSDQSHRDTGWNFDPTFAREAGFSTSRKPSKDNISKGLSLRADLDLGSTTFTSLTSADFFDRNELNDYGAGITPHIAALWKGNDRVFSQDFRLSSNGKQRFNWTLGSYLAYTRIDTDWFTDTVSVNGTSVETSFLQTSKSAALYGQSDYLLTDRLKFISGLRLERENISLDDFTSTTVAAPSATYPLRDEDRALNKNLWSGKLGLEYTFADNLLGYASISRGVKSGGFGGKVATLQTQLDPVKPEELIAYEVGFKADLTPTTRLNGAVFYYDYRNQQVSGLILPPTGRVVRKLENAERSHVYGGELEFQWRPIGGLAISQSLGYKTGRFDDYHTFNAQGQAVDLSGKRETFPKLSYGGSATYDWRVSDFKLQAEADYSYHDSQDAPLVPFGVAAADYSLDAYWLTNARLSLSPATDAWTVSLYSRNLFNTKYDTSRAAWSSVQTVAVAGAPRTVGVQLSVPF